MYKLYQLLSLLLYPLIKLLLLYRVVQGKEDPKRYKEKLGIYAIQRPLGKLIWFHAASIGEFNAILPIIKAISEKYSSFNILVTSVTLTAANIAQNNLPNNAIHQFMPLDSIIITRRFIRYWQPDLVIWTESEIWPNIINSCNTPLLLINARLSKKSFSKWNLTPKFAKFILDKFSLILAQSIETKILLEKLGAKGVIYSGNLKFMANNFTFNEQELQRIKLQMQGRIVLMAASTHQGEEEIFIKLHHKLKEKHPLLLTIIAPRHPNRTPELLAILQDSKVAIRSKNEPITQETDILLLDTIGEFGLFFRLTEIVCIGGSWKRIAHSFIEPAKLGNLIIFGPNMDNSREVADEFLAKSAAIFAQNELELEKIIENYLNNPINYAHFKDNATEIVDKMNQVKDKVLEKLIPYLDKL